VKCRGNQRQRSISQLKEILGIYKIASPDKSGLAMTEETGMIFVYFLDLYPKYPEGHYRGTVAGLRNLKVTVGALRRPSRKLQG